MWTRNFTINSQGFIPNTYVVRVYSDKQLFQQQTGWVDGNVEQLAETLRI